MPIHIYIVFGYFYPTIAELSGCDKDHVTHESQNIYYLAFYRKKIATLWCRLMIVLSK